MESADFVKADSRNLPVVDPFGVHDGGVLQCFTRKQPRSTRVKTVLAHAGWKFRRFAYHFLGGGGTFTYKKYMRRGGPRFVLESPGSLHGALIRPAGPWFVLRGGPWYVLRGPGTSCGALIRPARPDQSRGALISPAGPWSVPRGPDQSRGALISPAGPWFVLRALIHPAGPGFVMQNPVASR